MHVYVLLPCILTLYVEINQSKFFWNFFVGALQDFLYKIHLSISFYITLYNCVFWTLVDIL